MIPFARIALGMYVTAWLAKVSASVFSSLSTCFVWIQVKEEKLVIIFL